MKHWLKRNEIIYKRIIKGPASVEHGSDRKHLCVTFSLNSDVFASNIIPISAILNLNSNLKRPKSKIWAGVQNLRKE